MWGGIPPTPGHHYLPVHSLWTCLGGWGFNNWSCLLERCLTSSGRSLTGACRAPPPRSPSEDAGGVKDDVFTATNARRRLFPNKWGVNWEQKAVVLKATWRCSGGSTAWSVQGRQRGRLRSNDESSKNRYNHFCLTTEIKTN